MSGIRTRGWLGDIRPIARDSVRITAWERDVDTALRKLRVEEPFVDAVFRLAAHGGIAIVSTWTRRPDGRDEEHPLMEMASASDDSDWILVTGRHGDAAAVADVITEMYGTPLVRSWAEAHETPAWRIWFTYHS